MTSEMRSSENFHQQSLDIDAIKVSFLQNQGKTVNSTLPLIISPRFDDTLNFICQWLEVNRSWVENQILQYGAVLLRGFQINTPPQFERAMLALQPDLSDSYRGTSPRSLFDGTKYVFSAADVPVNYPIAQHLEMSFLKSPPRHLYFGCLEESSTKGGETSLCDFRKVCQNLDPTVRQKFEKKKLLYSRKHAKVGEKWTFDVGAKLSWVQLFGTSNPQEVESICQEEEAPPFEWVGRNKDTFFQEWQDDSFQFHPNTGEKVWFNHSQVFHWSTFPMELWYAFCRLRDIRFLLRCILIGFVAFIKYCLFGYRMALDTKFGDGTPISMSQMNQVRKAIHDNMVFSTWKKGDILCIDNFSTSHGRQPTYDMGRKILVAWSHPLDKTIARQSQGRNGEVMKANNDSEGLLFDLIDGNVELPEMMQVTPEVSPNPSPESTLVIDEAENLKNCIQYYTSPSKNINNSDNNSNKKVHCHKRRGRHEHTSVKDIFSYFYSHDC